MGDIRIPQGIGKKPLKKIRLGSLPLPLRIYILSVISLAILVGVCLGTTVSGQLHDLLLALVLVCFLVLAKRYEVHLSSGLKVSTDTTVLFSAALLFDPALAMLVATLGSLASNAMARRPWFNTLFNTAQAGLSTVLASNVYLYLAPTRLDQAVNILGQLPALLFAAVAMYAINVLLVDTALALHIGQNPLAGLWHRHKSDLPHHLALFLLGVLPALTARDHPWTLALVAIPTAVIHIALRDMVRLRVQTREAVEALADMVDLRDPYTYGHSQRVAELSAMLAKRLGLSAEEIEVVRAAARVHDIGKIAVPDRVLLKPSRLTEAEYQEMQSHQDVGAKLLEHFPDFQHGRDYVSAHHERPDGQGYGRGLTGSEIPIGAAIIAVADSFDAMTSNRPYRAALTIEEAVAELRRYRGLQWDARVVDAFLELLDEDELLLIEDQLAVAGT
ncbi:MAG: HD-GYP domain-containing protein [Chloroflexota bacterium]